VQKYGFYFLRAIFIIAVEDETCMSIERSKGNENATSCRFH